MTITTGQVLDANNKVPTKAVTIPAVHTGDRANDGADIGDAFSMAIQVAPFGQQGSDNAGIGVATSITIIGTTYNPRLRRLRGLRGLRG
jgi:hypothetical protein